MGNLIGILVGFTAGILLTIQICANRRLGGALEVRGSKVASGLWAASTSFLVGLIALAVVSSLLGRPNASAAQRAPWWAWVGGLMGAFYVASTIMLLPSLGALALTGVVMAGQLVSAVAVDHFGWLTVDPHPANALRLLGVGLLVAGVALVLRY
jgi:transporter family-2 protein